MKCIAIAEDELFMREELSDILRKAGYNVLAITEFDQAAGQLLAQAPDLVLLRISDLPGDQAEKRRPDSRTYLPGSDAG